MTTKEMYRRINTMMPDQQNQIAKLIKEGYGTTGIQFETGATIKQINAVAAWVDRYMGGSTKPSIQARKNTRQHE